MKYDIDAQMRAYLETEEIAQAVLLVRRGEEIIFEGKWGWSDIQNHVPIDVDSIFRMMSMTKCITAAAVMQLAERGKISLDAPLETYLPEFGGRRVAVPGQYEFAIKKPLKMLWYLLTFSLKKVKTVPANRSITVRDLLSHSSGLEQGMVGLLEMMKHKDRKDTSLQQQIKRYATYPLDFQPGTSTNYSPLAGFNVLGFLISEVTGETLEDYMRKNILDPMRMNDTAFFLPADKRNRLVKLYRRRDGKLEDVTGTFEDMYTVMRMEPMAFEAGAGGLFSTAVDYEKFASMLLNDGKYDGVQILSPESVRMIRSEGALAHLEPDPGMVWGLGVKIRTDPQAAGSFATKGTYGWSGAFGTHFFVSPEDGIDAVFMTNRSDMDGAGSYISKKVEEMVFGNWKKEEVSC